MNDTLTNAWFHRLKAANRQLIKKNGGIEEAAEIASLSKSQVGRCHADSDTELLPIAAALRLEAECGDPVITRAMAGLHGMKLADPAAEAGATSCLMQETMNLGALAADYQREAVLSFADLKVTPNEARAAIRTLEALADKVTALTNQWARVAGTGGTVPGLKVVGD